MSEALRYPRREEEKLENRMAGTMMEEPLLHAQARTEEGC